MIWSRNWKTWSSSQIAKAVTAEIAITIQEYSNAVFFVGHWIFLNSLDTPEKKESFFLAIFAPTLFLCEQCVFYRMGNISLALIFRYDFFVFCCIIVSVFAFCTFHFYFICHKTPPINLYGYFHTRYDSTTFRRFCQRFLLVLWEFFIEFFPSFYKKLSYII